MGSNRDHRYLIEPEQILEGLNPQQREAVLATEGPVLVVAGAGSGKTRVLTHRIAYLIGVMGVPPDRILAVTFTNKAADEMKERVHKLLEGVADLSGMWIGTFHSACVRMLRPHAERIGYKPNFVIYDQDDQRALLKEILEGLPFDPRYASSVISKMKNIEGYEPEDDRFYYVFDEYQRALQEANAMDFDDLILNAIRLLRENPDIKRKYAEKFLYIHVDEYQDTNRPQYYLLVELSSVHRNVFVVGDEDQSIYSFRGADIHNILRFEEDFPDARVIKLEQNYRSTKKILKAANAVISRNTQRRGKVLWTAKPEGEKVLVMAAEDEREEARKVVAKINELLDQGYSFSDIAVLYRTNAQSRAFEEAMRAAGIPYLLRGAQSFYERKEIKDILAYLRLIVNPNDEVSLRRVINVPPRRIGPKTIEKLTEVAKQKGISVRDVLRDQALLRSLGFREDTLSGLLEFNSLLEELEAPGPEANALYALRLTLEKTGYFEYLKEAYDQTEAEARAENLRELLGTAEEHVKESPDKSLRAYLHTISLRTELDEEGKSGNAVTLMTVHAAKGLEYPVVFVTGLEDGVFPHFSSKEGTLLEEERRLFYVAMTRAKERLFISHARRRYIRRGMMLQPSPFLGELPEEAVVWENPEARLAIEMNPSEELKPGVVVRHPKFGRGTVLEAYDGKVVVDFGSRGVKTLLSKFVQIEPLL